MASPPEVGGTAAAEQHNESDTPVTESPVAAPSKIGAPSKIDTTSPPLPPMVGLPSCPGLCCHQGDDWVRRHLEMDKFPKDMGTTGLDAYAWDPVSSRVMGLARHLRYCGLAPWDELPPVVRDKMSLWSPVAQQLWGSEFASHQEALIRAWIWHYLDDTMFSFSGDGSSAESLPCASPVWTHFRALSRELDVFRSGHPGFNGWDQERHRVQYHFWRRLTASLVGEGLGLEGFADPADLVPHFKTSLRLLLVEGQVKIPDYPTDGDWNLGHDSHDPFKALSSSIKRVLQHSLTLQEYQQSMTLSCRLRFTPIGSDKHWGFPVDGEWMRDLGPPHIPETRPGEPMPLVQLVSDPMLVMSGQGGWNYEKDFELWPKARMVVVTPWTFGGEEAEEHFFEGYDKDYEEDREAHYRARFAVRVTGAKRKDIADEEEGNDGNSSHTAEESHKMENKGASGKKGVKRGRRKKGAKGKK